MFRALLTEIEERIICKKSMYHAMPLQTLSDAPRRRDAQFENHCCRV